MESFFCCERHRGIALGAFSGAGIGVLLAIFGFWKVVLILCLTAIGGVAGHFSTRWWKNNSSDSA